MKMHLIMLTLLLPSLLGMNATAQSDIPAPLPDSVRNRGFGAGAVMTRWMSPDDSRPTGYAEWQSRLADKRILVIRDLSGDKSEGTPHRGEGLDVLINESLYYQVESSIVQYLLDLTGEGFAVTLFSSAGGTPEEMRGFLQDRHYNHGIQGFVFIGDLPVPWYETDFGDPPEHAEFPCDLYYMDLDGVFSDGDGDGMYDAHSGAVVPEVYLGRLTASPLKMGGDTEAELVQNYLRKNHLYRSDLLPQTGRALVYIDDDWAGGSAWWNLNVGQAYSNRTFVNDIWTTWGPDYISRLPLDYEFIQVCVHSWPGGHAFKRPVDEWSWVYIADVKAVEPVAHFYNLFACSNARYVEDDYSSGWYIFNKDHGLAAIGSTKSGSMLSFEDFYRPFGEGHNLGESFRDWFAARAAGGFEEWEITWFYGMTLNGDPTLRSQYLCNSGILQSDNGIVSYMIPLVSDSDDWHNVRFTPEQACTLSSVSVEGLLQGDTPVRMYLWHSDGTFPTTVIDSVDLTAGEMDMIDISEKNIMMSAGEDFHVGFSILDPAPVDTPWIYMDDGTVQTEHRSGLYNGSAWVTLYDYWGTNYNLCIRVEVRNPSEPEIRILTTSLAGASTGESYAEVLAVDGGVPSFVWEISAGALPNGLSLDPNTGTILGRAGESGTFPFSVRVTDAGIPPLTDVQHLSMNISTTCGDASCDGIINLLDVLYVIDYLYGVPSGSAPQPLETGDANADGAINLLDILYFIDYLYGSPPGPEPQCP